MPTLQKPLRELTAEDLMTRDVLLLTDDMPLREAARLLLRNQVGGAPVMNERGQCVGILSSVDFLRHAERPPDAARHAEGPLPITCSFQKKHLNPDGTEVVLCTLPPGVCPLQLREKGPDGETQLICSEPHCVLTDWQVVDVEQLPTDEVRQFMTVDPVTVLPETPLAELARKMIDAHIHRLIVVDRDGAPIGIVSSTDLLAELAYAGSSL